MPRIPVLVIAVFFFLFSLVHFLFADVLVELMPSYLPLHRELVILTGIIELMGSIGLLFPQSRLLSAYGLIALLIAVLPANINMAVNFKSFGDIPETFLFLRVPFQIAVMAFIWWAVTPDRVKGEASPKKSAVMEPHENLEVFCLEFVGALKHLLKWRWDERYQVALAEFGVEHEETVLSVLEKYLKSLWDNTSINAAPLSIKNVVAEMGGLKTGQLLFTSDSIDGTFVYCMLWPWGNQKTISIRISPWYHQATDEENQQKIEQVRTWFGIKPDEGWVKLQSEEVKI